MARGHDQRPRASERRELLPVRHDAHQAHVGVLGEAHRAAAEERERRGRARLALPAQEVVDHHGAALLGLDAADVDEVVAQQVEPRRDLVDRYFRRPHDPRAHHLARQGLVARDALDQLLFLGCVEDDRRRPAEELPEDAQVEDAVVLGGRHQQALVRSDLETEVGGPVAVREEDERVVVLLVRPQVLDQGGRDRAVLLQPAALLEVAVLEEADLVGDRIEGLEPALADDREAQHPDAVDARLAGWQHVLPAQVVDRGRGQDRDLVPLRHVLGDPAAVQLRPADDLRPVALDDEADLHPRLSSLPPTSARPPDSSSTLFRSAAVSTCSFTTSRTRLWPR